jgi:hypothetical protein
MPDPGLKIIEELPAQPNRISFELPDLVAGAENDRMGTALLL